MSMQKEFMKDSQGRLVPNELVKDIDRLRDETVREIVNNALALKKEMVAFKTTSMNDIQAFVELSAERYGAKLGGKKGNLTLMSYDGRYKLQIAIAEYIMFDEGLQIAKQLIDECINRWAVDAGTEIRALTEYAFKTNKEGNVSKERLLGLRKLDIKDRDWLKAMDAISDSMTVVGSKSYMRIYERIGMEDKWQAISLDIAAL